MVAAPEQEKPSEHPLIEKRLEEPGELKRLQEQERELEGYLYKVEREPGKEPVTDDTGQQVLTPTQGRQVSISLPLTEEEIKHGLHHKVFESIRWLAEWCVRMSKKALLLGIRIIYPKRQ